MPEAGLTIAEVPFESERYVRAWRADSWAECMGSWIAPTSEQLVVPLRMAEGEALNSLSLRMGHFYLESGAAKYEGKDGMCSGRRGKGEVVKKGWRSACLAVMRFSGS